MTQQGGSHLSNVQTNAVASVSVSVPEESGRRQGEHIKTVGPNPLYVALAAVHFKNHSSTSGNKSSVRQLKETLYVL